MSTTTSPALAAIVVFLKDAEGRYLALGADLDAHHAFRFARVTEARAFLAEHLGGIGYRVTDDCEAVAETVAAFSAAEHGNDLTADFVALLGA